MWKRQSFRQNGGGRTGEPQVKEWSQTYSLSYISKITSKWIKDLNARGNTMKLLEKKIQGERSMTQDLDFLDVTAKAQAATITTKRQIGLHQN